MDRRRKRGKESGGGRYEIGIVSSVTATAIVISQWRVQLVVKVISPCLMWKVSGNHAKNNWAMFMIVA